MKPPKAEFTKLGYSLPSSYSVETEWERILYEKRIAGIFGVSDKLIAPKGHLIEAKRTEGKWKETGFDIDFEKRVKPDADVDAWMDKFMPEEVAKLEAQNGRVEMIRHTASGSGIPFDFASEISHPFNSRARIFMLDYDILMVMLGKNLGKNLNWPALVFYDLVISSSHPDDYAGRWMFNHYETIWGEVLLRDDLTNATDDDSAMITLFNDAFHYGRNKIFLSPQWIRPKLSS